MLNFFLARVRVNARYNKISSVICKFENAVSLMNVVEVGRSDNEGCWSYRRSLAESCCTDGDSLSGVTTGIIVILIFYYNSARKPILNLPSQ